MTEQEVMVLNLRAEGLTLREIGERLDVGPERIRQIRNKALRKYVWVYKGGKHWDKLSGLSDAALAALVQYREEREKAEAGERFWGDIKAL